MLSKKRIHLSEKLKKKNTTLAYEHMCSILKRCAINLFVWAENKRLKVLLADLCERKILLAG
jgi:hypothetical protein